MSPRFALVLLAFLPACGGSRPADGTRTSTPATVRVSTTGGRTVALATTSTSEVAGITVNAPIERVWQALPAVYAELEVPVKSLMTNERMVGNPKVRFRRRLGGERAALYFDCGNRLGEPNADTYQLDMSLHTRLEEVSPTQTRVVTEALATAAAVGVGAAAQVTCTSQGRLEQRIARLAMEKARG